MEVVFLLAGFIVSSLLVVSGPILPPPIIGDSQIIKNETLEQPFFTEGKSWGRVTKKVENNADDLSANPGAMTLNTLRAAPIVETVCSPNIEVSRAASGGRRTVYKEYLYSPMAAGSYRVTSDYGERVHPIAGSVIFHKGVDWAAPMGTPIYAYDSGVVEVSTDENGGDFITITHDNGIVTLYKHMEPYYHLVSTGDVVVGGQQISGIGNTGFSTGAHLHFEVLRDGINVDPTSFLEVMDVKDPLHPC